MLWSDIVEIFVITTVISYLITPLVRMIAFRTGYLDHPKSNKVHAHPTPLLGGVGIYIAFTAGLFTTVNLGQDPRLLSIIIGASILLVVGLVDDRMGMMPEVKLLAQFLAAMVVIKSGVRIGFLQNYYLSTILTYLWIVGITNSFNLLDNMNGLSAGIATIAAVFFGIVMWSGSQISIAVVSFAIAGSSLGFLKHNFPEAKIFMGDSGSLVLGFLLASTAILGSWSTRFLTTSLAMPVIILAYPIFDTTLVTIMRIKEGRSIFQGGRDHSSHRLALLGFKKKRAVLVVYGICICLGVSALLIQRLSLKSAFVVIGIVIMSLFALGVRLAMVDTGRFGRIKSVKEAG
ncbi:MAG: undecaprenyl/decaprenyl-phosphate alpha-N-acetylglucosaminyl 1-phosphate transferase [Candidatus Omnitrophica bacterium]|nr:undecaprenyl/decaprenyl-phosphate alpha-N-acetylglucosaminyl 1-phosphate transferase [Candidatus Omnitrophota bacterium]MCM8790570.1 undecaprenyl/decaprenyl-phosphate alpha-N-acetylglucosaminyl 1-phosphate transferase [Candidatus Omnitrophota bacterium]